MKKYDKAIEKLSEKFVELDKAKKPLKNFREFITFFSEYMDTESAISILSIPKNMEHKYIEIINLILDLKEILYREHVYKCLLKDVGEYLYALECREGRLFSMIKESHREYIEGFSREDMLEVIGNDHFIPVKDATSGCGEVGLLMAEGMVREGIDPETFEYVMAADRDVLACRIAFIHFMLYRIPAQVVCGNRYGAEKLWEKQTSRYKELYGENKQYMGNSWF